MAFNNNTKNSVDREAAAARRAEIVAKQTVNLNVIEVAVQYLNEFVASNSNDRLTMSNVNKYLTESKGLDADAVRITSSVNGIILDLAKSRTTKYIDDNRVFVRELYIYERLKTIYYKELWARIDQMIDSNSDLFKFGSDEIKGTDLGKVKVESPKE